MRLTKKVALVTGAADERSIGWGIAQKLAEEGASIILNDLPHRMEELKTRVALLKSLGGKAIPAPADITNPEDVHELIKKGVNDLGQLDILCSNAGIIRWQPFLEITPEVLREQVNLNLTGNMMICQTAAKQMIAQNQGGRIIITSSVQTYFHFPITPVYGGTKHAMHIFVGALALELAPYKITVNHIGPGWVKTAINDGSPELQSDYDLERQSAAIPLRRAGTKEEMAMAVAYYASDQASYTTGAFLPIDGGLSIGKYSY